MPFVHSYQGANRILTSIGTGKCAGNCKKTWMRTLRYALRNPSNPLHLTKSQIPTLRNKLAAMGSRSARDKHARTLRHYKGRPSPSVPANLHCGQTKQGNDRRMYISKPNKRGICRWISTS